MKTRNTRRFRLNGMTLALAVALPGMMTAQMVCAETKADATTSSAQKATKSQKEDTILVTASPGNESATSTLKAPVSTGALGTASALDTPFSVSTVTEKDIQDKQISTFDQMIASDASFSHPSNGMSDYGASYVFVRGITSLAGNNYINGQKLWLVNTALPLEVMEKVDLLKGASGFMYGFGTPGGIISYSTKKATSDGVLRTTAGYRTQGVFSQHIDAGGRTGPDDLFGVRVNLVNEKGNLDQKDARIDRQAVGISSDIRLTPSLILTGDLIQNNGDINNQAPATFDTSILTSKLPNPVRMSKLQPSIDNAENNSRLSYRHAGAVWDFFKDWSLKLDYANIVNKQKFNSSINKLINQQGDFSVFKFNNQRNLRTESFSSLLAGSIDSFSVTHNMVFGYSSDTQKMYNSPNSFYGLVGKGNLYDHEIIHHNTSISAPALGSTIQQKAVFISDRLVFNDNWEFLAGIRRTKYTQNAQRSTNHYNQTVNSPTLALVFKPEVNTSIYTSYVEALEQGAVVGQQYKNANQMLPPLKSKQYEVGVKTDQNRWSATAALFRIERGAEYANADNVWVQDGEERYQGLELGGRVIISKNFDLSASTMWLDPTYRNVAPTKNLEGKTIAGVPRFQSSVEFGWIPDTQPDLRTSLRWRHEGSASPDERGDIRVPSHDLLDFFVNYDTDALGTPVTARFGITNVTNKKYWAAGKNSIFAGEPRTFMANVSVSF